MKPKQITILLLSFALLLPACQPTGNLASGTPAENNLIADSTIKPSSTTTKKPMGTSTLSPSPANTQTAKPTITPTSIGIPNLRVAYGTNDGLWIVDPPEPPVLLINSTSRIGRISFSEDGYRVLYVFEDAGYPYPLLNSVNSDGSDDLILLTHEQLQTLETPIGVGITAIAEGSLEWIPGTHKFFFFTRNISAAMFENVFHNDLFLVDTDTGWISRIFARKNGGSPLPSPDGEKMALSRCGSVSLATIFGKVLFADIIVSEQLTDYWCRYPHVVWKADSSTIGVILFMDESRNPLRDISDYEITVLSIDVMSGVPSLLFSMDHIQEASFSSTLEWVGYTQSAKEPSDDETRIVTFYGSSTLLATGPGGFMSFAPDGLHFAFYLGPSPQSTESFLSPSALQTVYICSVTGKTFPIPGTVYPDSFLWINNLQFVYQQDGYLRLGDIGGNSIEIAHSSYFSSFDAMDIDFQASRN